MATDRLLSWLTRHWTLAALIAWLLFCAWFIFDRRSDIRWFNLGDTDDNMRMMQVRGLLHGQGWFDLRQYRLNPPFGANVHWSRLVDLPIAGLILSLRPFLGGAGAERIAVGIAPLLPYLLLLISLALTARRLIGPLAYPMAFAGIYFAGSTNSMFMPERIDHHGWQLALLALSMASLADPKRVRGGLVLGISTALSLAIGLEMIIYLAAAGAAMVLFWVVDTEERGRLSTYALSLVGATALCFLAFTSYDNRSAVCDALSPVWLSDALIGGALMYGLAWLSPEQRGRRLLLAVIAGVVIAAFHGLTWPHCTQRLEGVSPEVDWLWLSHVREARPVYKQDWRTALTTLALPVTGCLGWLLLAWWRRRDPELQRRVLAAAIPCFAATALLFWQIRTGPAAQMLGVVGAVAIAWILAPPLWNARSPAVRVLGVFVVVLIGAGAAVPLVLGYIHENKPTPHEIAINHANALCNSLWAYHPVALQPKGVVFTFVDFGPRLITVTHHDSIVGPYHRNGQQIADVMNAFRGSEAQARALIGKYHSSYLLTCPNSSTTTIFASEAPKGFYQQLANGKVPGWLSPIDLGKVSPFRMWRVVG
ncbi:MAG: AcrB/AcrD/AcrF family protein [Sphingomonas sp.]|nr:AcrB/AcrD/AcrF family protein [Sphingomonas sp.]